MTEPAKFDRAAMEQRQQARLTHGRSEVAMLSIPQLWDEAEADLTAALAAYDRSIKERAEAARLWTEDAQSLKALENEKEELEAEVARLQQALETERESHQICTEGQQVMLDQMNRLQQAAAE